MMVIRKWETWPQGAHGALDRRSAIIPHPPPDTSAAGRHVVEEDAERACALERPSAGAEQGQQAAAPVEIDQIIAAADVGVADEDLRHRAPAGQLHHLRALRRFEVDADFVDVADPTLLQQRLGADAVRASLRQVHANGLHAVGQWLRRDADFAATAKTLLCVPRHGTC
jgi:hypothetical protein